LTSEWRQLHETNEKFTEEDSYDEDIADIRDKDTKKYGEADDYSSLSE